MTSSTITIPALGLPFTIGSLYNDSTSQLILGIKLFTKEKIHEMLVETANFSMETEIQTEASMLDKHSNTNIKGKLSLSLLAGAISASGSGSYQTTAKEKKDTESVVFHLKVHGKYVELQLPPECEVKPSVSLRDATHIVVGIQYGGAALFRFELSKEDSATSDKTGGNLSAEIGKFASLVSLSGSTSLDITSEEVKQMQKIRVVYNGDFHLASPPTSFVEAMKCIQSIQSAEARSPLTVTLLPLSLLFGELPQVPSALSSGCISKAVRYYKELNGALATLGEIVGKLKYSMWIHVVKKLEAKVRELRSFKASLDDAVMIAVKGSASDAAEGAKIVDKRLSFFDPKGKYSHLLEWANAAADAVDVLVVISDKFRATGAQIIASQAQRAIFFVGSVTEEFLHTRTLYSLSCPMSIFELEKFNNEVGLKLWTDEEQENSFYKELGNLRKGKVGDTNSVIAVEQSNIEEKEIRMRPVQLV